MDYIIIISMIIVFIFGFVFIDKISVLIDPVDFNLDDINEVHSNKESEMVLIYGDLAISRDIIKLLEKYSISFMIIKNADELNNLDSFKYLIAVDELDLENLVVCSLCRKMMGITEIISICNFSYNKKIFEDNHIPYLCGDNISAFQLVSTLFPSSQKLGGKLDVHN